MNCPHCSHPIPDAAVVKAAAQINGNKGGRPPGKGKKPGPKLNPAIKAIMAERGCSRQRAHQIRNRGAISPAKPR